MTTTVTIKKVHKIEDEIIGWAKLLSTCKHDSTRFEQRVESIEHLIQVRKGLLRLIKH